MKHRTKFETFHWLALLVVILFSNSCNKGVNDNDNASIQIGKTYAGGIIFYVDSTKKHGMVCAPADQDTAIPWSLSRSLVTGAMGSDMGTGRTNTEIIVAVQGTGHYAARVCYDLTLNGYSDWFLPSKSECLNMYFNLKVYRNIGGFADTLYWSSTESAATKAFSQYSNDGYLPEGGYYKTSPYHVRAVRAF
jgi:hypothetical protein